MHGNPKPQPLATTSSRVATRYPSKTYQDHTFYNAKRHLLPRKTYPFTLPNVTFRPRSGLARAAHESHIALPGATFRPAAHSPSARQAEGARRPETSCKTKKQEILTTQNGEYLLHCQALATRLWRLLAVMLVRNGELLATLGAAGGQNATAILRGHSLTEAVLVHATAVVGLKCSFHLLYFLFIVI